MSRITFLTPAALLFPVLALAGNGTPPKTKAGMGNMVMGGGADPKPAVNIDPSVLKIANSSRMSALSTTGLGGVKLTDLQCSSRENAVKALTELRAKMMADATDPATRDISVGTLDRLIGTLQNDKSYEPQPAEIKTIPEMLVTQVQLDSIQNGRPLEKLSPAELAAYEKVDATYKTLMPEAKEHVQGESAPPAHAMHGSPLPPNEFRTADDNPPPVAKAIASAAETASLMDRFHTAYAAELDQWKAAHPPAPAPAPAPGENQQNPGATPPPPSNPSNWSGLPPSEHIGGMIDAHPNDPAPWQLGAADKLSRGDFSGAASDAQRAVDLGGGTAARLALGDAKYGMGDFPGAYAESKEILEAEPGNLGARALMHFSEPYAKIAAPKAPSFGASALDAAGAAPSASRAAVADVLKAARAAGSADSRREIANALRLNDLPAALTYADRALAQDPGNAAMLNLRAAIHARMRDYDKAAADAQAGLALAPRNATLLRTLAYAQLRGKHDKEALASAGELLALNPADPYALALRAHAEGDMGERDAMMADINRAAALDPRYEGAAADLAKLVQLPSDKDVLFLFPGEEAAPSARTAAPAAGRGRRFGLLVGASALGGLLLALGLLATVLAPLKERVTSAFTRITRSGPSVAANATEQPASVNGLVPGLIRGQYEISRQIGAGGMGMVYEGTDRSLGRRVAIKKMRDELRVNPQERARFVIEAKTVAALHHPNIVDIYSIAEDGADVYLIFEYVDGKTVHDLVQLNGRLPLAQSAGVARAVAGALDYAHAHGVIHRDMKPSNVMLDSTGRVKVMDFGIARMAKDSMTRYSMTNTVVGTPPYMAPEQEQGHVRRESDVYALAVCAYEMLTGKLPFIGIGAGMLMNKINMSYVAPSRATAGVPEALDAVFTKAFQADPDKRYRTPKEFADALESALPSSVRTA